MSPIIAELIDIAFDKSEVYNSSSYQELQRKIDKLNKEFSTGIEDKLLTEYTGVRADFEILFYQYGFLEGMKFINEIVRSSVDELIQSEK